jgi:hypothetical protein
VFTGDDAASETKVTRGGTIMTAKELKLDYFQIYDVANRQATGNIFLQGQFDKQRLRMQLALLDFFANPVAKNAEPIYDKNAHLTWYRGGVQPPEPMRAVILENQFGKFEIRTGRGEGLLVPTQKKEPGSVFPKTLDHYKVYLVVDVGKVPDVTLKLRDQFGTSEARLGRPLFFSVPVRKRHETKEYPIQNERAHLLIFAITPRNLEKKVTLQNQFIPRGTSVAVVRSVMLAVPSIKNEWKQV